MPVLEGLDEEQTGLVNDALARLVHSQDRHRLYRDYYNGNHRLVFATTKYREAFGNLFAAFADNLCPAVVDAVADKLAITGWSVAEGPQDEAGSQALTDRVQALWDRNRMDRRAGEVHQEALRQGDAYVLVWAGSDGKATLWPQRADQVAVEYDPENPGQVLVAVKAWRVGADPTTGVGGRVRVNVYLPDRLLKYVTRSEVVTLDLKATTLQPWTVQGEAWPLGHNLGVVPVVPFPTNATTGQAGVSDLRDVIPLQDALNKAVTDMLVAMEYVAMPQRWATGIEVPIDPDTGKPVEGWKPDVKRLWSTPATDARFGQFDQADLAQFLNVQDGFRAEVARVSATPFHYLMLVTGDFPSGEAMKTAEARHIAKVKDRQATYGEGWSGVVSLALAVEGTQAVVEPDWADPAPKSEKDHLEGLKVKSDLGVPQAQLWREMGYTQDEVEDMTAQAEERRTTLADSMAQALNAGM